MVLCKIVCTMCAMYGVVWLSMLSMETWTLKDTRVWSPVTQYASKMYNGVLLY